MVASQHKIIHRSLYGAPSTHKFVPDISIPFLRQAVPSNVLESEFFPSNLPSMYHDGGTSYVEADIPDAGKNSFSCSRSNLDVQNFDVSYMPDHVAEGDSHDPVSEGDSKTDDEESEEGSSEVVLNRVP